MQHSNPSFRASVFGPGPVFVHWTAARATEYPELAAQVADFDAGDRDAALHAASWLRDRSLVQPSESVARLLLDEGRLLGFYALASGSAELTVSQRRKLEGSSRRTQPATILTQIARERRSPPGTGAQMVQHAIAVARRAASEIAATVLAVDPHDADTMDMWMRRYGFEESAGSVGGADEPRLWIRLSSR